MPWTNDQTWALVNKPEPEEIRLVDLINKPDPEEIYHHGIKGQKWGVRRYQNPDGSLTPEGRKHYGYGDGQDLKKESEDEKTGNDNVEVETKSSKWTSPWGDNSTYSIEKTIVKGKNVDPEKSKEVDKKFDCVEDEYGWIDGDWNNDYYYDACEAMSVYAEKGPEAAIKYLNDTFKGIDFTMKFNKETNDNDPDDVYSGFTMIIRGEKYGMVIPGEVDYTDEEYFFKIGDED